MQAGTATSGSAWAAACALLLAATAASGAAVTVRFRQHDGCAGIARWEVLAAPADGGSPDPDVGDAQVVGTVAPADAAGACGPGILAASVEVAAAPGPLRWWLRAVGTGGGTAVSAALDAELPPGTGTPRLTTVGGGGNPTSDCILVLSAPANYPPSRPHEVRCVDGDPACDGDGAADGACNVPVALCANATWRPDRCRSPGVQEVTVQHAVAGTDPRFDPAYAALQAAVARDVAPPTAEADRCTLPVVLTVPLQHGAGVCRAARRKLAVTSWALDRGRRTRDRDRLVLQCLPAPGACPPAGS